MLTVKQVADRLNLSITGVRWRLRTGRLPGYRLGAARTGWRISERELHAWMESKRNTPPNEQAGKGTGTRA